MTVKPDELEEGEKVLFNDRKTPLKVSEKKDETLLVEGPNSGEYEIYSEDETLLVCRKGNRRYSSYCENLRKVGEWQRNGDKWEHTKTGAVIEMVRNDNGFWTLNSDKFGDELDLPKYGYSSKEFAEEDAEKFVGNNPEG